jgi:hypothetical protein
MKLLALLMLLLSVGLLPGFSRSIHIGYHCDGLCRRVDL